MIGQLKLSSNRGFTLIELLVVIAIIAILAAILFPVFAQAREKARQATCESNLKQIGLAVLQYVQDYDEYYPSGNYTLASVNEYYWPNFIYPYVNSTAVFNCPDLEGLNHVANGFSSPTLIGDRLDYGFNVALCSNAGIAAAGQNIAKVNYPDQLIMAADERGDGIVNEDLGWNGATGTAGFGVAGWPLLWYSTTDPVPNNYGWVGPDCRHQGFANIVYADGHVKKLSYGVIYNPPVGVTAANFRLWHYNAQ